MPNRRGGRGDGLEKLPKLMSGEGEGRKHCFANFCSFALLYLSMGEELCVGAECLI